MKTINVADKPVQYGLSMHPPIAGYAFAEYQLGSVYESLNVAVALNDDVKNEDDVAVVFSVYGDGRRLWESSIITKKGKSESAEIKLLDVNTLQLRVNDLKQVTEGSGVISTGAHAVFSVANVEFQTTYRRWYRYVI